MRDNRFIGTCLAIAILFGAVSALSYLTETAIYGPPSDYLNPAELPVRSTPYRDPVFNPHGQSPEWIWRLSDAASTPRIDGVPGNVPLVTHEYATTSPFNSDRSMVLLIHQAYYALYDSNGVWIRDLLQVCASCAPRWSRLNRAVFYYIRGKNIYSYDAATNRHAPAGNALPYDQIYAKGEDGICFDGDHLIGDVSAFANIDSAEIAPNDIVIVSYLPVTPSLELCT